MPRDFYSTAAQVLPVLLLAIVWESKYLDGLLTQQRQLRRDDPERGVRFWSKPRVRIYALTVTTLTLAGTVISLLVLAGLLPNWTALGAVTVASLVLTSVSLLYRICSDILAATRVTPDGAAPASPADIQE